MMGNHAIMWAFMAALASALILTRVVEVSARRFGLYRGISSRDAHSTPTPRLGGLAIAIAMGIGVAVSGLPKDPALSIVIVGATGLVSLGTLDDVAPLPALLKLLVQGAIASVTVLLLEPTIEIDLGVAALQFDGLLASGLAVLWIVGLINVINFMDGIDGIAAGVAAAAVPGLALVLGGDGSSQLLIVLAGACLGFLAWNHHPATIFMGDGGSYLVGYVGAAAVFLGDRPAAPVIPAAIAFSAFLLDVSLTLMRRGWARRDLLSAHSDHLYQQLVRGGYGQRDVMVLYVGITVLSGMAAVAYLDGDAAVKLVVLLAAITIAVGHTVLYRRVAANTGRAGGERTRG